MSLLNNIHRQLNAQIFIDFAEQLKIVLMTVIMREHADRQFVIAIMDILELTAQKKFE